MSRSRASRVSRMLDTNLLKEAASVGQRANPEVVGDGLTQIREGRTRSEIVAGLYSSACDQQGNVLPGMIGAWCRRIVAVVGRDGQKIGVLQPRQEAGEPRIEPLEIGGIARRVVS